MPVRNEFVGQYDYIQIKSGGVWKPIIANPVTKSRKMDASVASYLQGTIEPRIMDIGAIQEDFKITSPILIGGASSIDGRTLISNEIANVLYRHGTTLPLLASASVNISGDQGASVDMTLASDGSPAAGTNFNINAGVNPPSELNPLTAVPSRVAKWYDFRIQFGPFVFYVINASITFTTQVTRKNFIGGYVPSLTSPIDLGYNFGTQYPWISVSGLTMEGNGKAAVLLSDYDCKGDVIDGVERFFRGALFDPPATDTDMRNNNYAVNWNPPWNDLTTPTDPADVTLQCPGFTRTTTNSIIFEVYNSRTNPCTATGQYGVWGSLFMAPSGGPLFDFSKGIITKADLNIEKEMITVDFSFMSYIVKPVDAYCTVTP